MAKITGVCDGGHKGSVHHRGTETGRNRTEGRLRNTVCHPEGAKRRDLLLVMCISL